MNREYFSRIYNCVFLHRILNTTGVNMKTVNLVFNILLILLIFLLANYFFQFIKVAKWITAITLVITTVLFFIRIYARWGKR